MTYHPLTPATKDKSSRYLSLMLTELYGEGEILLRDNQFIIWKQ